MPYDKGAREALHPCITELVPTEAKIGDRRRQCPIGESFERLSVRRQIFCDNCYGSKRTLLIKHDKVHQYRDYVTEGMVNQIWRFKYVIIHDMNESLPQLGDKIESRTETGIVCHLSPPIMRTIQFTSYVIYNPGDSRVLERGADTNVAPVKKEIVERIRNYIAARCENAACQSES